MENNDKKRQEMHHKNLYWEELCLYILKPFVYVDVAIF